MRIVNYGSFTTDELFKRDVCNPVHPFHNELLEILQDDIFDCDDVNIFTIKHVREKALLLNKNK
jgi:hypothetical protein